MSFSVFRCHCKLFSQALETGSSVLLLPLSHFPLPKDFKKIQTTYTKYFKKFPLRLSETKKKPFLRYACLFKNKNSEKPFTTLGVYKMVPATFL